MRKSFLILTAVLVCALNSLGAVSQPNVSASVSQASILTAAISADEAAKRITEARALLQTGAVSPNAVTLALFDIESGEIKTVSLSKDEFLTKNAALSAHDQDGSLIDVQIVRANGVNTAISASTAANGQGLVPLLVQYPIVKNGAVTEIAYYTSAH